MLDLTKIFYLISCYVRIVAVVRHPGFYYVFTTIGVLNLPRFAPFCLFCDKFNNPRGIYIPGKSRQNRAEYGISGGFSNMIKILFVCHGNICRSTMAQFVFQDMINKSGLSDSFYIDSAATSREEIGNPPHHGTRRKLRQLGIPCGDHRARQMRASEYDEFDYIIGMDSWNIRNINQILGNGDPDAKVAKLLDFTKRKGQDIADPWYTGNFDVTYEDVKEGCEALLQDCLLRL